MGERPAPSAAVTGGRLPDFLLVGATKAGTTSLVGWMAAHPEIYIHPEKEMRFFFDPRAGERLDAYRARFAGAGEALAVGEASNGYTRDPVYAGIAARIAAALPGVRLVYAIREPMRRLESHYRHRLATGREWRGAEAAIAADPGYVAASLYGHQLAVLRRHFPARQIHVVRSDRLFRDPAGELSALAAFLGVPARPEIALPAENRATERPVATRLERAVWQATGSTSLLRRTGGLVARLPLGRLRTRASVPAFDLAPATRAHLEALFEEDRRRLADLAGGDVADWGA